MRQLKPGDRVHVYGPTHCESTGAAVFFDGTQVLIVRDHLESGTVNLDLWVDSSMSRYVAHRRQCVPLKKKAPPREWSLSGPIETGGRPAITTGPCLAINEYVRVREVRERKK